MRNAYKKRTDIITYPPIRLPTVVAVGRKITALNLNIYRNMHKHVLGKQKENYAKLITPLVTHLPRMDRIEIHYVLYPLTKRKVDTSNVTCIVNKYFCDVLTSCKIIPDDNFQHVISTSDAYGEVDNRGPYVLAYITQIGKDNEYTVHSS